MLEVSLVQISIQSPWILSMKILVVIKITSAKYPLVTHAKHGVTVCITINMVEGKY